MNLEHLKSKLRIRSIPNTLYKYFSVNDHFFSTLNKQELYFNSPYSFNDPFECRFPKYVTSPSDLINYRNHLLESGIPHLIDFAEKMELNNGTTSDLLNKFVETNRNIGVCCFSIDNSNALMWSHYANKHEGICLGFDVLEDYNLFCNLHKVLYRSTRIEYNYLSNPENIFNFLSTKSDIWKYENEIRVFQTTNGLHSFNKSALKNIVFGCRTNEENKREIIRILSLNEIDCQLYEAKVSETDYKIEIVPIK